MARRDLKTNEQIFYDELITYINRYTFSNTAQLQMIETLDNLIDEIIKNEENPDNYSDWEL